MKHLNLKSFGTSSLALALFTSQITPTFAAIVNTATVTGTYGAGPATAYGSSSQSVDVAPSAPVLTMLKTAGAPSISVGDTSLVDAGDTIEYTYVVKNEGNVTLNNVIPVDTGPTFNSLTKDGSLGGFDIAAQTLLPGATATFKAIYLLTNLDAYHAAGITDGVSNTSHATGYTVQNPTTNQVVSNDSTTKSTIPAGPKLSVDKVAVLTDAATTGTATKADVGEYIDYTYTVVNNGNVPMTDISINDDHESAMLAAGIVKNETLVTDGPYGVSTDEAVPVNNGIWKTLQPGATLTFTYHHQVTQVEVDNQ